VVVVEEDSSIDGGGEGRGAAGLSVDDEDKAGEREKATRTKPEVM